MAAPRPEIVALIVAALAAGATLTLVTSGAPIGVVDVPELPEPLSVTGGLLVVVVVGVGDGVVVVGFVAVPWVGDVVEEAGVVSVKS